MFDSFESNSRIFFAMLLELFPNNPDTRKIDQIIDTLKKGGIVVFPTDTVYAFGVDLRNKKALEKLAKIKGVKLNKANFSLVCFDLSHLSDYTKPLDRKIYKALNKTLPGPFTFILNASNQVPKLFGNNKKDVGIRIPDNNIIRIIAEILGNPLAVSSVNDEDEIIEYTTDPEEIHGKYEGVVDIVIDSGYSKNVPSTVVDCTTGELNIIREGAGDVELL